MNRLQVTYQSYGFIQELIINLHNQQAIKRDVEILKTKKHERITTNKC